MTAILFGTALIAAFVFIVFLCGHESPPPGVKDGIVPPDRTSDAMLVDMQKYGRQAEINAMRTGNGAPPSRRASRR
jgi:hypothetical protein